MPSAALFFVFLVFLCHNCVLAKHDFELQFDNFNCSTADKNGEILQRFRCGLNKNAKRRTINMEFTFKKALQEHDFFIVIVLPRPKNNFVLLNLSIDGCNLLSNKNQVPLMKLGRSLAERYSNFPNKCPFEKGKTYYIRGFRFDLNLIPAISMETPMAMEFGYRLKNLDVLRAYVTARVMFNSKGKSKWA